MPSINENFLKLEKNYLFINIAKKVKAFTEAHPEADIIRMGIGDVTQPIAKCVVEATKWASRKHSRAMRTAVQDMTS